MNDSNTPTPLTDADWLKSKDLKDRTRALVMRNRAARLETDLATALRERDEARALLADYEPLMSKGAEAMSVVRWLAICLKLNGPNWSEEPGFATTLTAPLLRLTAERDAALAQLAEWKRVEESVRAFAEHMGWNEAEPFVGSGPIEQRLSTALLTSIQQTSALAEARKDSERLDWLEANAIGIDIARSRPARIELLISPFRAAIDAAKEQP